MLFIEKEKGSIYSGATGWQNLQELLTSLDASKLFVLVDKNSKKHCLPIAINKLSQLKFAQVIEIPAGESHKNIHTCLSIWENLSQHKADRHSILINLGGGVVTDIGGFTAATYMRGIRWINVPTTLLAMVDAAVGGKNGVDLGVLKNHIGVIQPPEAVLVDTHFLKSLPNQEVISGYAEMLKHGLINSKNHWRDLEDFNFDTPEKNEQLVLDSISIKNRIVTKDPFEKKERKTLNYGHTLGHAIESYCLKNKNREQLLHGHAIALGMILETYISTKVTGLSDTVANQIVNTLFSYYKKEKFTMTDIEEIIALLQHDKKNKNGNVQFVLLNSIGSCTVNQQITNTLILEAFDYYSFFDVAN